VRTRDGEKQKRAGETTGETGKIRVTGKTWTTGRKEKRKGNRPGGNRQALAVRYEIPITFYFSIHNEMKRSIFLGG
jgi:hypothetical protein